MGDVMTGIQMVRLFFTAETKGDGHGKADNTGVEEN